MRLKMLNNTNEDRPSQVLALPTPVARRFEGQVVEAAPVVEALPSTLSRSRTLELLSILRHDLTHPAIDTPVDTDEDQSNSFVEEVIGAHAKITNFHAYASIKARSLLELWTLGANASYSATGAAILKSQEHTYNTREAATTIAIGTLLLSPLYLYLERMFARAHAKQPCALSLMRMSFLVLQPALGLVVLQQMTDVKMSIEQNIAAYFTGAAILVWGSAYIYSKLLPIIYDGGGDLATGPIAAASLEQTTGNTAAPNTYAAPEEGNNSALTAAQLP